MKIWYGHGSEHSANLVMIGHFEEARNAAEAKEAIDRLTEQVRADQAEGLIEIGGHTERYGDRMLKLLQEVRFHDVRPYELEQFAYDFSVELEQSEVVIKTEESDVSAFLKLLVDKGARVEVYSAHSHPDSPHGRGK
jgi:hypothetical protein